MARWRRTRPLRVHYRDFPPRIVRGPKCDDAARTMSRPNREHRSASMHQRRTFAIISHIFISNYKYVNKYLLIKMRLKHIWFIIFLSTIIILHEVICLSYKKVLNEISFRLGRIYLFVIKLWTYYAFCILTQ